MKLNLDPFSTSTAFRSWVYESIILKLETNNVKFINKRYNKSNLKSVTGLRVEMRKNLNEVQSIENEGIFRFNEEYLVFYFNKGTTYEVLFKRLRDAFAHGHYGSSPNSNWITIKHEFKGRNDKDNLTRIFGCLKVKTLKKLISHIDCSSPI